MTALTSFEPILARAAERKGGLTALNKLLPKAKSPGAIRKIGDDRFLAEMTKCVFRAGFVWRVIEDKWPGFEAAFCGFNPEVLYYWPDEQFEKLAQDTRIVRNFQKITATRENAAFVVEVAEQHGSFARWIADWPVERIVELWLDMKKRGSRLGGMSGPMMLRGMGKDSFILTGDVVAALNNHAVIDSANPTSKRALLTVQDAFNEWAAETGRPLCELSRILAFSVG